MSDEISQVDLYQDLDDDDTDRIRAGMMHAVRKWDPEAAVVTRYFATVEYVDTEGAYGIINLSPADSPSWQTTAVLNAGADMWERHLEKVAQLSFGSEEDPDEA
jgi:hypothetical protein